ncbi:MAG: hypothetical protein ACLQVI_08770 [Polyangiaceae bacterium]
MRLILAGSVVALVAFAGFVFVACQSDAVIIGIEGDGGPSSPLSSVQPPGTPHLNDDSGETLVGSATLGDAGFVDADEGPCLPDAGCPVGAVCQYPVEAGCGALGECFAIPCCLVPPPPPIPPPVGFPLGGIDPAPRSSVNGYLPTPPSCDGGAADATGD